MYTASHIVRWSRMLCRIFQRICFGSFSANRDCPTACSWYQLIVFCPIPFSLAFFYFKYAKFSCNDYNHQLWIGTVTEHCVTFSESTGTGFIRHCVTLSLLRINMTHLRCRTTSWHLKHRVSASLHHFSINYWRGIYNSVTPKPWFTCSHAIKQIKTHP